MVKRPTTPKSLIVMYH